MSSIEIELKLSVKPDAISAIRQQLFEFPHDYTSPQHLTNIYYETPDNQLRRWDMGLRIRGFDGHYEMTIKTAGKVVGGLHQRPEFNVPLHRPELDLAQFPSHIWPENISLSYLQEQLRALFSTDFSREKWLVSYGQSEIEVVLDQGMISAGNSHAEKQSTPICEFELELINGNVTDVLSLANKLASQSGLRLANKSKAARGYALVQALSQASPQISAQTALPNVVEALDWQQPLLVLLSDILAQWQTQEEGWLAGLAAGKTGLMQVLLWGEELVEKQAELLPEALERLPDLLSELRSKLSATTVNEEAQAKTEAEELCYSTSWLQCKLALTQWLIVQSR
ncbi:inorganic triphosphatase [Xenorhabdus sp. 12]|uniref:Inorganic triphosphatase n=1 Tax=Xenorhabdus santafensis TaxID=2582833 RepID=A0ABU4S8H5_9GAMM|nr:CYTH domain-containing protein [Xenorhabdus sp. 12]MDX7987056.1 inorganic triphosphatase [Xenorhabdus sp. 12]